MMEIKLPVQFQKISVPEQSPYYQVRPLFFEEPCLIHRDLNTLHANFTREVRKKFQALLKEERHDDLARWCFCPEVSLLESEFLVKSDKTIIKGQLKLGKFSQSTQRFLFPLEFPEWWFVLERGEDLETRLNKVLNAYIKAQGARAYLHYEKLAELKSQKSKAWLEVLSFELPVPLRQFQAPVVERMLFGFEQLSGAEELEKTGYCLEQLPLERLSETLGREQELALLQDLLRVQKSPQPIALIGPPGVGKTALLHQWIRNRLQKNRKAKGNRQTWLLSPLRLQAGMMYVGQWETRLLAILEEIETREHLLVIDNLPGWYQAGRSMSSDLSMGECLRQQLDKRQLRLLVEMTPDTLLRMRELDRGFIERFHCLQLEEMSQTQTFRVAIQRLRKLESTYQSNVSPEVLPLAKQLQERFEHEGVFPGKLLTLLDYVVQQHTRSTIQAAELYSSFAQFTGLSRHLFANREVALTRAEIGDWLKQRIFGQEQVLTVLTDIILTFRAGLNDPERPIASLLFLGPTGVGKTETAKALAEYFFSSSERLLRFDMNEYQSEHAVARLTGTTQTPDGLLTQAIRQSPFAVILLDEIEKAHPGVFDLLLQILGEGRLTDAHGRVAHFSNALIILTSNLGAGELNSRLGFNPATQNVNQHYRQKAQAFFRPELFNRLDHVLPFMPLKPEFMLDLARKGLQQILGRQGLSRRKCIFQLEQSALQALAHSGYHPDLGARYLKRHLERQVAMPLAALLAGRSTQDMTLFRLSADPEGLLTWQAEDLKEIPPWPESATLNANKLPHSLPLILAELEQRLAEIFACLRSQLPQQRQVSTQLDSRTYHLYSLQELAQSLQTDLETLRMQMARKTPDLVRPGNLQRARQSLLQDTARPRTRLDKLWAAQDLQAYLKELRDHAEPYSQEPQSLLHLRQQMALAESMAMQSQADEQTVLMWIKPIPDYPVQTDWEIAALARLYQQVFEVLPGLEVTLLDAEAQPAAGSMLLIRGFHALALASLEAGIHLFDAVYEPWLPVRVICQNLPPETPLEQAVKDLRSDPVGPNHLIRLYASATLLDLRSGVLFKHGFPPPADMRQLLLLNHMRQVEQAEQAEQMDQAEVSHGSD
jgi:ATP-dependent Clp protease ATP-binding subunit ClpC